MITDLLIKQNAALKKMQAVIKAGHEKIAAVDQDLKPDVRRARMDAVRAAVSGTLGELLRDIHVRRDEAKADLPKVNQAAARRRAKFANDPSADALQRLALFETLKRAPTSALVEYLKDAVGGKNLAAAEATRLEFETRSDTKEHGQECVEVLAQAVDPEVQEHETHCNQIIGFSEYADVLFIEFGRGTSMAAERMTAVGVPVEQTEQPDPADLAQ